MKTLKVLLLCFSLHPLLSSTASAQTCRLSSEEVDKVERMQIGGETIKRTVVVKRYYVTIDEDEGNDFISGFDSEAEAQDQLAKCKAGEYGVDRAYGR